MKKLLLLLLFPVCAMAKPKPIQQKADTLTIMSIKDYRLIFEAIQALKSNPNDALKLRIDVELKSLQSRVRLMIDTAKGGKP